MAEDTNAWLRQAEHELRFARQALASGANDIACYLGQQALEKYLKGLIILAGREVPRIHNLYGLASKLRDATGIAFTDEEMDALKEISFFNIVARYPMGGEELAPMEAITAQQAQRTIDMAARLMARLAPDAAEASGGGDGS